MADDISTIVEILCVLQTRDKEKVIIFASTIVEILCVLQTCLTSKHVGKIYDSRNSLCLIDKMVTWHNILKSTIVEILCVLQTTLRTLQYREIYDSRNSLCLIDIHIQNQLEIYYLRQQKFFVSYRQEPHKSGRIGSTIVEILCVLQTRLTRKARTPRSTIVEILCVLQTQQYF